jgi:hypothetical protein
LGDRSAQDGFDMLAVSADGRVRTDAFPKRYGISSGRPNDHAGMRGLVRLAREGVDDWDKTASFGVSAAPRRSTSSLNRPMGRVMTKIAILFLILAPTIVAQARIVKAWSYQELYDQSDLIVIAKHISSERTAEQWVLPNISPNTDVVGLSSKFAVFLVLKGDQGVKTLILHHYQLKTPVSADIPVINGPMLASFDSDKLTKQFLLFLHRESDGRYAPVSGQTDPRDVSIFRLAGPNQ